MKKLIKNTWKHFVVAFVLQIIITLSWGYLTQSIGITGQCLLAFVAWSVLNWGFEIYQKNNGGKNTFIEIIQDCLSAGFGAVLGVLIGNIF